MRCQNSEAGEEEEDKARDQDSRESERGNQRDHTSGEHPEKSFLLFLRPYIGGKLEKLFRFDALSRI